MDQGTDDIKEFLILEVEKNPILYDKQHRNFKDVNKKRDVWKEIGNRLGISGEEAQKKWTNIRDAFAQNRKKTAVKSGSAALPMRKYKYAGILEFLIPHLQQRATSSNWTSDSYTSSTGPPSDSEVSTYDEEHDGGDDAEQESTLASNESRRVSSVLDIKAGQSNSGMQRKKTRMDLSYEVDKSILQFLSDKKSPKTLPSSSTTTEDEIDLFFGSMAATWRRLPSRSRAEVQFEIHRVVHRAEMEALYPPTPVHGSNIMNTYGTMNKTVSEEHCRDDMQTAVDLTMDMQG